MTPPSVAESSPDSIQPPASVAARERGPFAGWPRSLTGPMSRPTTRRGALLVLVAVVLVACAPADRTASPTPTRPAASPAPSATEPGSEPAVGACAPEGIASGIVGWEGAAGSRIAWVDVQNLDAAPCLLEAPAAVALLDGRGEVVAAATGPFGDARAVELGGGATGRLLVGLSNWCAAPPAEPLAIGLTLGGMPPFTALPVDGVAFELPPCNGPGQAPTITVGAEGWTTP